MPAGGTEPATHNEPPQGATPAERKHGASAPKHASEEPTGSTTNTEQPKPTANATEPQEPEPQPEKEEETRTPAGHAPSGNATSKPPPAAHQETSAAERRANEVRHTRPETKNEATENTEADGKAERTHRSTPLAQPTARGTESGATTGKKARHEVAAAEPQSREPEKATRGKEPTKEARETTTKTKK